MAIMVKEMLKFKQKGNRVAKWLEDEKKEPSGSGGGSGPGIFDLEDIKGSSQLDWERHQQEWERQAERMKRQEDMWRQQREATRIGPSIYDDLYGGTSTGNLEKLEQTTTANETATEAMMRVYTDAASTSHTKMFKV